MKKLSISVYILLALTMVISLFASCTQGEVTKTVTVTTTTTKPSQQTTATVTSIPFTITITMQPEASTPIVLPLEFEAPPPAIPHIYVLEDPSNPQVEGLISETGGAICFECHGVPPQHNIWAYDPEICLVCHIVSDNPTLDPHWPAPEVDIDS
ncbi:hypothetical protein ACFLYS_01190 [Chloroflexota bacterium]